MSPVPLGSYVRGGWLPAGRLTEKDRRALHLCNGAARSGRRSAAAGEKSSSPATTAPVLRASHGKSAMMIIMVRQAFRLW